MANRPRQIQNPFTYQEREEMIGQSLVDTGLRNNVTILPLEDSLYNDHKWHNPVVIKLENVRPAFETPPCAETGRAKAIGPGRVELERDLTTLGGAAKVTVGFEYQVYGGFAEAMYNTEWTPTETSTLTTPGRFVVEVDGLESGVEYQFRAVVTSPKITMRGDHRRVVVK